MIFYLPGDSLRSHNNMEFTTHDNDNDEWGGNCAADRGNAGNWWGWCGNQNMNGVYGQEDDTGPDFMTWGGYYVSSLKTMKLMIRSAV